MVSDHLNIVRLIDHIDVTVVIGVGVSLVGSIDLDSLVNAITSSIHGHVLCGVPDQKVFRILTAVEFNERCAIAAIEAGMLSRAKLVELVNDIV